MAFFLGRTKPKWKPEKSFGRLLGEAVIQQGVGALRDIGSAWAVDELITEPREVKEKGEKTWKSVGKDIADGWKSVADGEAAVIEGHKILVEDKTWRKNFHERDHSQAADILTRQTDNAIAMDKLRDLTQSRVVIDELDTREGLEKKLLAEWVGLSKEKGTASSYFKAIGLKSTDRPAVKQAMQDLRNAHNNVALALWARAKVTHQYARDMGWIRPLPPQAMNQLFGQVNKILSDGVITAKNRKRLAKIVEPEVSATTSERDKVLKAMNPKQQAVLEGEDPFFTEQTITEEQGRRWKKSRAGKRWSKKREKEEKQRKAWIKSAGEPPGRIAKAHESNIGGFVMGGDGRAYVEVMGDGKRLLAAAENGDFVFLPGMAGPPVRYLQEQLNKAGALDSSDITGYYDEATRRAVGEVDPGGKLDGRVDTDFMMKFRRIRTSGGEEMRTVRTEGVEGGRVIEERPRGEQPPPLMFDPDPPPTKGYQFGEQTIEGAPPLPEPPTQYIKTYPQTSQVVPGSPEHLRLIGAVQPLAQYAAVGDLPPRPGSEFVGPPEMKPRGMSAERWKQIQTFPRPDIESYEMDPPFRKLPNDPPSLWLINKTGGAVGTFDFGLEKGMREEGYTEKEISEKGRPAAVHNQKYLNNENSRERNLINRGTSDEMVIELEKENSADFKAVRSAREKSLEERRKLDAAYATATVGILGEKRARLEEAISILETQIADPKMNDVYREVLAGEDSIDVKIIQWAFDTGKEKVRKRVVGLMADLSTEGKMAFEAEAMKSLERRGIKGNLYAGSYLLYKHKRGDKHLFTGVQEVTETLSGRVPVLDEKGEPTGDYTNPKDKLTEGQIRGRIATLMTKYREDPRYKHLVEQYEEHGIRKLLQTALAHAENLSELRGLVNKYGKKLLDINPELHEVLENFKKLGKEWEKFLLPEEQFPADIEDMVRDSMRIWYHGVVDTEGGLAAMEDLGKIGEIAENGGFFYKSPGDPQKVEWKSVTFGFGEDISLNVRKELTTFTHYARDLYSVLGRYIRAGGMPEDEKGQRVLFQKIFRLGKDASIKIRNKLTNIRHTPGKRLFQVLGKEYESMIRINQAQDIDRNR